jgi:amidase
MHLTEYAKFDGLGLAELVHSGEVTAQELAETAKHAIDITNPKLNFLAAKTPADAETALKPSTNHPPFEGLPFLMKEGQGVKGQTALLGSRYGKHVISKEDSEFTRRVRQSGAVILGCTNTPEFGNSPTTESVEHGLARNPWDLERMTGGSSGGSAAAVAAGVVPIAQASDGGGSIRTPAHCCGVIGLKPTRARTPIGPLTDNGPFGLNVSHVLSRTVRDSAAMLDALHGPESGALFHVAPPKGSFLEAASSAPGRLRIAFSSRNPSGRPVHSECIDAVESTASLLEELGHQVCEAEPAFSWEEFIGHFLVAWCVGLPFRIAELERLTNLKAGPDLLETCNLACLEYGLGLTAYDIGKAISGLNQVRRQIAPFFEQYDVLLTPTDAYPALKLGEINANAPDLTARLWFERAINEFAPFPPLYNMTGQPAISLPLHHSEGGLPVGVQCVGRFGDEETLIALSAQLEQARPWINRFPPHGLYS